MSDPHTTTNGEPVPIGEMAAIHGVATMVACIFFKWNGANGDFWAAGEESIIANGIAATFDIVYWLCKPRILRWRGV